MRAASAQNAISGFTSTGVWPTNRHIFDESDFLPSTLTDRPEPSTSEEVENVVVTLHDEGLPRRATIGNNIRHSIDSDRTVSPSLLEMENINAEHDISESTINVETEHSSYIPTSHYYESTISVQDIDTIIIYWKMIRFLEFSRL